MVSDHIKWLEGKELVIKPVGTLGGDATGIDGCSVEPLQDFCQVMNVRIKEACGGKSQCGTGLQRSRDRRTSGTLWPKFNVKN